MSARNWTPGPWVTARDNDGDNSLCIATIAWVADWCIGIPTPGYPGGNYRDARYGTNEADARLIAAAPALYDALAATPCTCTTVAGASHGGQTEQLLDELCGRCAALRLAEGDEA